MKNKWWEPLNDPLIIFLFGVIVGAALMLLLLKFCTDVPLTWAENVQNASDNLILPDNIGGV